MRIVNVSPGTDDWHGWRRIGVTASDSAVVLDVSPYKTIWRLWAEKTGRVQPEDLSKNPFVRHGKQYEDRARQCVEKRVFPGELCIPVCGEHERNPMLKASFDGVMSSGVPVEIKCPLDKVWAEVRDLGTDSKAYNFYWYQVQHQLLVSGQDYGYLFFWYSDTEYRLFRIERDDDHLAAVEKACDEFMKMFFDDQEPQKDTSRDVFFPRSDIAKKKWARAAHRYSEIDKRIKELEAEMADLKKEAEPLKDEMVQLMGDFALGEYAGVRIWNGMRRGPIDYRRIVETQVNLSTEEKEVYRKKGSGSVKVTVTDPNALGSFAAGDTDSGEQDCDEVTESSSPAKQSAAPAQKVPASLFF